MSSQKQQKLTPSESNFVNELLKGRGAPDAWRRAHPVRAANMLPASIHVAASRLIRIDKVEHELRRRQSLAAARADVTADRVLAELARIGFSDVRELERFRESGRLEDLSDNAAAAVQELTVEEVTHGRGGAAERGVRIRYKLHPKLAALEALAKHLGIYQEISAPWAERIPDTSPVQELTVKQLRNALDLLTGPGNPGERIIDPGDVVAHELLPVVEDLEDLELQPGDLGPVARALPESETDPDH